MPDGVLAEKTTWLLTVRRRHGHVDSLARDRLRAPRDGQIDVDAALNHRRRHHEDDEQHQHDVDERDDVDFGERRRHAAAARPAARRNVVGGAEPSASR